MTPLLLNVVIVPAFSRPARPKPPTPTAPKQAASPPFPPLMAPLLLNVAIVPENDLPATPVLPTQPARAAPGAPSVASATKEAPASRAGRELRAPPCAANTLETKPFSGRSCSRPWLVFPRMTFPRPPVFRLRQKIQSTEYCRQCG